MTAAEELIVTNALLSNGLKTGDVVHTEMGAGTVAACSGVRVWVSDGRGYKLHNRLMVTLERMARADASMTMLRRMAREPGPLTTWAREKLAEIEAALARLAA